MSIILVIAICICNIFYSIWYIENEDYETTDKKLRIKRNGKIAIYTLLLIITIIVYYCFGVKYSIGISFIASIILQDKVRYKISDLTTGMLIMIAIIFNIAEGKFIPILISTAVTVFPVLIIYLYGPIVIKTIKSLIWEDDDKKIKLFRLADMKVLIGIMMFMAVKVTVNGVISIISTIMAVATVFILPQMIYFFYKKIKTTEFAFSAYIFIGVILYVEIIIKR